MNSKETIRVVNLILIITHLMVKVMNLNKKIPVITAKLIYLHKMEQ